MDIQFENKTMDSYREFFQQNKRVQVNLDGVVPDTNEDIGRIVSVQSSVCLKSKEVFAGRVSVSGEVQAVLIYITEREDQIALVRLSKGFETDFEHDEIQADTLAHIQLRVANTEARVLNPRKVSVTVELAALLCAYHRSEAILSTSVRDAKAESLHVRQNEINAVLIDQVCEKTFAMSEQFVFPAAKPAPDKLICQNVSFSCAECQQVGSRVIVKGNAELEIYYLSDTLSYPVRTVFSVPFSQIVDVGDADFEQGFVQMELTSAYFDLVDTISGEKALDAELHAVMQLTGCCSRSIQYIADVYSNRMPVQCQMQTRSVVSAMASTTDTLSTDEAIEIAGDCADILSVFPSVTQLGYDASRMTANVQLEILYATKGGSLSCVKRQIALAKPVRTQAERANEVRIRDLDLRPEGERAVCRVSVEVCGMSSQTSEFQAVCGVTLEEGAPFDVEAYPTITLVRSGEETLWELAKQYHSSVDAIVTMNDLNGDWQGRLLMIPKQV